MSPSQDSTPINATHLKNRFAHRFVRALNNLITHIDTTPHHDQNQLMHKRSTHVKIAAYTAMASVVGSRRAWSRAVLRKIRINRSRNYQGYRKRAVDHHAKVRVLKRRKCCKRAGFLDEGYSKLRKIVPGGESMDSWCLIGETADYIKCLAAQVEVMKTLVDLYAVT